ncbi:Nucleolar protein 56 [Malassezia vespertilionis]|uniref:Nucleolar protein 56 n=1 Tax=Malassezia vespertilionis TaxID=2020962 RepID=A0A2N1JFV7_9BASI|nr:Nucleolar protein 56 [Malassezia vespertilionis]PKI85444.1 Nop56p [Malassezia vespertilionis]WFD05317.1 Nucleolar protein 56 [Malassezia vespertilionis]
MPGTPTHVLFESAAGLALFKVDQSESIGSQTKQVQEALADLQAFGKMVRLVSFSPFTSAPEALQGCLDISEGIVDDHLRSLLTLNLRPEGKKVKGIELGVADRNLASSIVSDTGIPCDTGETSQELIRGVRLHADKMLKGMMPGDLERAQLGLGHSYSRSKVKFNVNRSDNMIIQAIALLDTLDKDVNTFAMRVREWYGWHFPELVRLVPDNITYARLARFVKAKEELSEDKLEEMTEILEGDEIAAQNILDAGRASMGTEIGELDMINIENFADRVVHLATYRKQMHAYLVEKMHLVAPNLSALIGEVIGARLISHAGSLTNLAKYPASTVQILGAEKALFRALKTKGNTPKYGLIYHASAIARAAPKNKGRMSRFLANKISIASRIDCFSEMPTTKFGEVLHQQVEERLEFYETGKPTGKNSDAMHKAIMAMEEEAGDLMDVEAEVDDDDDSDSDDDSEPAAPIKSKEKSKASKKDKKEKKSKKSKSKSKDKDKASNVEKAAKKAAKKAKSSSKDKDKKK